MQHFDVLAQAACLLADTRLQEGFATKAKVEYAEKRGDINVGRERVYSELFTAEWWEATEASGIPKVNVTLDVTSTLILWCSGCNSPRSHLLPRRNVAL